MILMVLLAARRDVLGGWSVFAVNDNEEFEWTAIGETAMARLWASLRPLMETEDGSAE
jgi:hypothetical protein